MRGKSEREYVLAVLTEIRSRQTYSHIAVRQVLDEAEQEGLSAQERAFIKRLAEGIIERQTELDGVIASHTRKGTRIKPVIRDILRMGIYQILYMDAVPDAAACNEAAALTKAQGKAGLTGFVNAVLRTVAREHAAGKYADAQADASMPAWIADLWREQLGEDEAQALICAMIKVRPVTIRVDERLDEQERTMLLSSMREAGAELTPGRFLPYAFDLRALASIGTLPGFQKGQWAVQDESSMLVAEAAGLTGNETVYDLCAAPGGKSLHCAAKLAAAGGKGMVHAFDLSGAKTKLIRQNAERMQLSNIAVLERDARLPFTGEEREKADVLICDLPCSGLGVMGHKRDIKYRVEPQQLRELAQLQRQILKAGVTALKPGGTLIYSTCTINRGENEEIASYIEEELGLVPDALAPFLPSGVTGIRGNRLQLLPSVHGTDGFFIARFTRAAMPHGGDHAK